MSVLSDTLHAANGNEETVSKADMCPRRLSRVSRLRDMFQTGVVKPIDDTEDGFDIESPVFSAYACPDFERFSRAFPGSPPMKTLRNHRTTLNKNESTQHSTTSSRSVDGSFSIPESLSPLKSPPTRPPKPRNISLSKSAVLEEVKLKPISSKIAAKNTSCNGVTEPVRISSYSITNVGNSTDNQPSIVKVNGSSLNSTTTRNSTPVTIINAGPQQTSKNPVECLSYASITPLYSSNKNEKTTENDVNNAISNDVHSQSCETTIQPSEDLNSQSTHSTCNSSIDHQCTLPNSSDIQDFVLRPEAFHKSPFPEIVCKDKIDDLPVLQHAEPVAVNAEDDDDGLDEKIENTENSFEIVISSSQCNASFSPLITLPVPKGLNVVAVDDDGVHIFEDGNFLYALPGLTDKYSDDSDFYDSREDITNISDLISPSYTAEKVNDEENAKTNIEKVLSVSSSNSPKSITTRKLVNKRSGSSDSLVKQPRVRFSSEPILVFSTHSTTDYNRRNEEIDPLSASAEYELEKHLEDMDMFEIDFRKGVNGLGISIVGSGVDTSSGEQKLSIFIKSLTSGGAAEADGRIQVYDQIVQVDGHSLVGVSQQFAAQVLQNTGEIIHFVIAREKDPPNSRIAKILTEKQQEEDEENNKGEEKAVEKELKWNNNSSDKYQEFVSTQTDNPVNLSGGDSTEALHNLIAVATRSLKEAKQWNKVDDDDNDEEDAIAIDESSIDCDMEYLNVNNNNDANDSSPINSLFQQFRKSSSGGDNVKSLNGYSTDLNYQHSSPRSALKGTATAASTRRRNEAIMEYIRQAVLIQDNVHLPTNLINKTDYTDKSQNSNITTDCLNTVSWALASELHDHRIQLRKFQSRNRNLEQRLTAQEAAADEAIERLCLRCRHLELELKQSQQKCSQLMSPKQQNISNSNNYSLGANNLCNPIYHSSMLNASSYKEDDEVVVSGENPDVVLKKCFGLNDTDESIVSFTNRGSPKASIYGPYSSDDQDKVKVDGSTANSVNLVKDGYSTTVELPLFVRQVEDRTRIVSSGGLAGRRPPTKITSVFLHINSPFASLHGPFAASLTEPRVPSVKNPFNSDNNDSCLNKSSNTSQPPRPVPPHSFIFHRSSSNERQASSCQSKSTTNNLVDSKINSTQMTPSRKPVGGYQLPGLSDNSFSSVLRRTNICTDLSKSLNSQECEP
ncbi:unnamed protein product [Schistosoma rodhaini]|nr:unnamed protein product [Schistosoma rodhaini]